MVLLATTIKILINKRRRRRYCHKNVTPWFWVNPVFIRRSESGCFQNLTENMRKAKREMYFM